MARPGSAAIYLAFAANAFKRQLAYRVANWAGLFTNTFFLFFRGYALEACYTGRALIAGFTVAEALSYTVISQALLMVVQQWGRTGLSESVRTGQIAIELCRPVSYCLRHMTSRLGVSAYYVLARGTPLVLVGLAAGMLAPPASIHALPALALSIVLGAWIAHCVLFMIEVSSFWLESDLGVRYMVSGVALLFSGLILPLAFFPDWAQTLSETMPFRYTLYLPVEIYIGKVSGDSLVYALLRQLGWAVGCYLACLGLFALGTRKLVIHGG